MESLSKRRRRRGVDYGAAQVDCSSILSATDMDAEEAFQCCSCSKRFTLLHELGYHQLECVSMAHVTPLVQRNEAGSIALEGITSAKWDTPPSWKGEAWYVRFHRGNLPLRLGMPELADAVQKLLSECYPDVPCLPVHQGGSMFHYAYLDEAGQACRYQSRAYFSTATLAARAYSRYCRQLLLSCREYVAIRAELEKSVPTTAQLPWLSRDLAACQPHVIKATLEPEDAVASAIAAARHGAFLSSLPPHVRAAASRPAHECAHAIKEEPPDMPDGVHVKIEAIEPQDQERGCAGFAVWRFCESRIRVDGNLFTLSAVMPLVPLVRCYCCAVMVVIPLTLAFLRS